MHHIQKHITQILDGEAQPRYDSPELAGVLADIRAILRDRHAQQALGAFRSANGERWHSIRPEHRESDDARQRGKP